ncbi:MAG: type II secretion system protein GspM [Sphingomonadaceae bacterium]
MRTLSARERRLIALLILAAVCAAIWLLIVSPIVSGFAERDTRRAALLQQYQMNQRIIGSIPRLRRQVERQRDDLRSFAVSAATPAAAALAVQERLQRVIEDAGGEARALEEVTTSPGEARVRVNAQMSLAQIATVLSRLQNEPPYGTIGSLNVTADQAVISGKLEPMEVSFEVSVPVILAAPR